jgi:hypothetical protein
MNDEVTIHLKLNGSTAAKWQKIWRDPRFWVMAWAIYALCVFAWLGYRNALFGSMCVTAS